MGNSTSCCFSDVARRSHSDVDSDHGLVPAKKPHASIPPHSSVGKPFHEENHRQDAAIDTCAQAASKQRYLVNMNPRGEDGSEGKAFIMEMNVKYGLPIDVDASTALPYDSFLLGPPLAPCTDEVLRTQADLQSLDQPPCPEIQNILRVVYDVFKAKNALVALFDDRRIFIRNAMGTFHEGDFPWRWSFCGWTLSSNQPVTLVIEDALLDARFSSNKMVHDEGSMVRFYVGAPLIASTGHRIGTLCFTDTQPRCFDAGQCAILNNLAELAVRQLENEWAWKMKRRIADSGADNVYSQLSRRLDWLDRCLMVVDTSRTGWTILYANNVFSTLTGLQREDVIGQGLIHVFGTRNWVKVQQEVDAGRPFTVRSSVLLNSSERPLFDLKFRPAEGHTLDKWSLPISSPTFIQQGNTAANTRRLYFITVKASKGKQGDNSYARLRCPMVGLHMGHMIGKGGYARVYYGNWHGLPVAIKVIDSHHTTSSVETILAQQLSHPNVIKTIKYAVIPTHDAMPARNSATHTTETTCCATITTAGVLSSAAYGCKGLGGAEPGRKGRGFGTVLEDDVGVEDLDSHGTTQAAPNSNTTNTSNPQTSSSRKAPNTPPHSRPVNRKPTTSPPNALPPIHPPHIPTPPPLHHPTPTSHQTTCTHAPPTRAESPSANSFLTALTHVHEQHLALCSSTGLSAQTNTTSEARRTDPSVKLSSPNTSAAHNTSGSCAPAPPTPRACEALAYDTHAFDAMYALIHQHKHQLQRLNTRLSQPEPETLLSEPSVCAPASHAQHGTEGALHASRPGAQACVLVNDSAKVPDFALQHVTGDCAVAKTNVRDISQGVKIGVCDIGKSVVGLRSGHVAICDKVGQGGAGGELAYGGQHANGGVSGAAHAMSGAHGGQHVHGAVSAAAHAMSAVHGAVYTDSMMAFSTGSNMAEAWQLNARVPQPINSCSSSSSSLATTEPSTWIIMEFCNKGCLQDAIDKGWFRLPQGSRTGRPDMSAILACCLELSSALAYLHANGVVHGDLSAANVLLMESENAPAGRGWVCKVADLGLAHNVSVSSVVHTNTYGTITHMPCELMLDSVLSHKADVYAFGVLCWQMFTGSRPWAGLSHARVLYQVCILKASLQFPPNTPPAFQHLAMMCMASDPDARPTMQQVHAALSSTFAGA